MADSVVVIPETNTSSTVDNTTNVAEDQNPVELGCTPLDELDLVDTFIGMDIAGNTEFWGSMSGFWRPCFIIYCVLFYAVLLILFGICVGLLCYTLKQAAEAAHSLRTLVYLLTLYIIWSTLSLAHGVLMIISTASGSDNGLAHATIILDTITSASFASIILVAIFSSLVSMVHFTLQYALLSTSLIFVEAIIIVILSIPIGISVTLMFVCMIVLRSLMFITSVISLLVVVFFKHSSLSTKELICMLWKNNKILLIVAFPYFLLWYAYFLYAMITILSSSNCTEDIQLQRAVWLMFNSLLRICEVIFSVSYFMKTRTLFKETLFESDLKLPESQEPEQTRRSHNIFALHPESSKPRPVGESIHQRTQNYTKSLYTDHEHLPCAATNVDVSESMSQSTVTSRLHDVSQSVDSDRFLDYSSSDTLNVEVVDAHAPVDRDYLIGEIEVGMFDERGGVFHSYKHGVTVIIPVGAIPSGVLAELKFAATLISPVPFQSNTVPFSAIFWLCMNSKVRLQKPIELHLPLLQLENIAGALQFAKSSHLTEPKRMEALEDGTFVDGECYGSIEVDHFCYYCITKNNLKQEDIPFNQYLLVAMTQRQPSLKDKSWSVHICLVPDLRTCDEYLKEQYNCDWEYKKLTKFSFVDGCNELEIEFLSNDFGNSAKIDPSDLLKIKKEDVDFHQYYSNGKLEELKNRMDRKEYPPRCKATVVAKNKSFFAKAHRKIIIQCANHSYKGKISIPCTSNEGDSSESDAELTQPIAREQIKSSTTSGYMSTSEQSDNDVDDFESTETASGKPKLRKVVVLTSDVGTDWYKLGIALHIPFAIMTKLYKKYNANPMEALNKVYCYWLSDKNNLSPTWEKLSSALQEIKQFSIATDVEQFIELPSNDMEDSVFIRNDPNDLALKKKVIKYIQLELLDMDTLVPLLNKYQLLTQANMYDLKNRLINPTERANLLVYHILPSKGPRAFTLFVKCLQEEKDHMGHQTLARLFTMPSESENASHQNPPPRSTEDPTNQSAATTSPPTEKECDMKTMYKYVVNKLAPHWTTVGDYLEYSVRERNSFKGADDKKSLITLLENWIGTDSGMKPKTWSTFIGVLMELDQDFSISVGNEIRARLERELSISALPESFV